MAVLAAMFAFVACSETGGTDEPTPGDGTKLAKPELTIKEQTETSFTVAWNAVSGADAYMVNMNSKNYTTDECEYTFENLNGGEYTVRVKATGKGYKDSDNASIKVTVTGLTKCDWFEQELIAVTEPTELNDGTMVYPYEALFFNWKGTDIKSIQYGLFATADVETASPAEIKKNLNGFSADAEAQILAAVNGADGFTSVFNKLTGSTSYTLYTLVTNADGVEYLASSTLTTAEAEVSEDTKAWLGTYTAQTAKIYDIATSEISEEVTNFTFTVTSIEGTTDEVYIDGLSIIGTDLPAMGQVAADGEGNILMAIWNYVDMGPLGGGFNLYWYALCATMGDYYLVSGSYPAYILTLAADGTITCEAYAGELSDGSPFEVAAFDVIGVDANGEFGIPQDQDGNPFSKWKMGVYTNITKTGAAPAALNAQPKSLSISGLKVQPSVVF